LQATFGVVFVSYPKINKMRKTTLTLLLFALVFSLSADELKLNFHFTSPIVKNIGEYTIVELENCRNIAKAGEPTMPWHKISAMLPPGQFATNVRIEVSNPVQIELTKPLYPGQYVQPISKGGSGIFVKNETLYKSSKPIPENTTGHFSTHHMNGFGLCASTFTPVSYVPSTGVLTVYQDVCVIVETSLQDNDQEQISMLSPKKSIQDQVIRSVQNPAMMDAYSLPSSRSDQYDMLIVTSYAMLDNFEQLKDMYQKKGIIAKVKSINDIVNIAEGRDDAEKLRNYIKQEYSDYAIEYVVLGGDVELVPFRGLYCAVQSSSVYEDSGIPADVYFSGLDGDWDSNGNDIFGEYFSATGVDEADLYPEVAVARLTINTLGDFTNMMNKTEQYQFSPVLGELQNVLLAGEHLYDDPLTWGADYLDLLHGYHDENGYATQGIPEVFDSETLYDRDLGYWSSNELRQTIATGKTFIDHVGHSNFGYAMRMDISEITNSNFAALDGIQHNFPFIYSHGCMCGGFDVSDCIAEEMIGIANFAVAVAMNSRYGWFNEGQTEGPSQHINREFLNAIYADDYNNVAVAHKLSKVATAPWVTAPDQWEEGALRWCFYDCNILGDAGLDIWSYEPKVPDGGMVQIENNEVTTYDFLVSSNNLPLPGATCVMMHFVNVEPEIRATAVSDANGIAHFDFGGPLDVTSLCNIWVSGFNIVPVKYDVDILAAIDDVQISEVSVYPVPAKNSLFLSFDAPYRGELQLVDLNGRIVKSLTVEGQSDYTINIEGLNSGLYFLHASHIKTKILVSE
jgi:Peptidase family C25/Secretion system C-terminal sorting domain/Propeptide_C25